MQHGYHSLYYSDDHASARIHVGYHFIAQVYACSRAVLKSIA